MSNYIENKDYETRMYIKASCNEFYLEEEIQLVAIKESIYGIEEIDGVNWEIKYTGKEVVLVDNVIKIKSFNSELQNLEVSFIDVTTGIRVSRCFPVIQEKRVETLVHFIKKDGDYYGNGYRWELWNFSGDGVAYEIPLSDNSDFGKCAFVKEKNIIARKRAWGNDWAEQTITFQIPDKVKNCYIIYGEDRLITNLDKLVDYLKPRIEVALMDDSSTITAFLSKEPLDLTEFYIYINGVKQENIEYKIDKIFKKIEFFNLNLDISPKDLIEIRASDTYISCRVTLRNYLDRFYYKYDDMGVVFTRDKIKLRVWAPTSNKVDLLIYSRWISLKPLYVYPMHYDKESGTYFCEIDREKNEGKYYKFKTYFTEIDINGYRSEIGKECVDPYANAVSVNGTKGCLIDLDKASTMPKDWQADKRPKLLRKEDSIIYELHLRDFTISEDSGIDKKRRGTYLGLTNDNASLYDSESRRTVKVGLNHLKELGITHIHVLPVFDFGSVNEAGADKTDRSWGYDPKNYNVPDGCYSSDAYSATARIIELRSMIKALHDNNIRVIMDVVYNHMQDTMNLDKLVPKYYFRTNYKGRYTNGSGCGNEIATERPMVRKYILDSIKHWLKDYKVDGFRFDLMGLIDIDTIKEVVKITEDVNDNILVYGEPWKAGESPLTNGVYKGCQRGEDFSIFNDTFRDYIRGNNTPSNGFVNGNQHDSSTAWSIIEGLKGGINTLTYKPRETINYVDAHDNYTLWDQIEKSLNREIKEDEYRKITEENIFDNHLVRRNILALSIIFLAQGIPFIQGGAEILRTKNGDHNSYKSSDKVNAIYWEDKIKYYEVFNFVKSLIAIRKKFKAFRFSSKEDIDKIDINFLNGDDRVGVIKWHYKDINTKEGPKEIIAIFNGTSIDNYDVNYFINNTIKDKWLLLALNNKIDENGLYEVSKNNLPTLNSYSILIMCSR